jgi:nicotinamide-nucleotide amidase
VASLADQPPEAVSDELARRIILKLRSSGSTVAVAESLTGGLVVSRLIDIPRASEAVAGGVVTYATELKARLLGVDQALLDESGAVHERVAAQMAEGVRELLAIDGRPADYGLATTGVAGPEPQDGHLPGEVFIAIADAAITTTHHLQLAGDRNQVRAEVVEQLLRHLDARLALPEGWVEE